jgi:alginate O-acetyltransferase complex protein AlgI
VVFASFIFLFWFLPLALPLYFAAPTRLRNVALIVCSFGFYGWWRPQYVGLMLLSVLVDYVAARMMGSRGEHDREGAPTNRRKRWLMVSVVANLGLLAWFKYANLFADSWNEVTPWPIEWEAVVLPIGISFFTFQSMSYTIDVYRGDVKPARSLLDLLCFVSMFPQLVAGPIIRYRDIEGSLARRVIDLRMASDGVLLFAMGFAKKVLIADSVGLLVDHVYAGQAPGLVAAWFAAFAYAFQIYFDFSGYSDMAIGLGLLLGFRFPENFRSPYRAHSIVEFWRRWHISLSSWLRDYLYVPLGGNRCSVRRTQFNLFATMMLGGLWHGAAWTFLLWGAWHGLFLALERRIGRATPYQFLPHAGQVLLTFMLWTVSMVIFRSKSMSELGNMFGGMIGLRGVGPIPDLGLQQPIVLGGFLLAIVIAFFLPRSQQLLQRCHPLVMLGVLTAFVIAVCQVLAVDFVPFIYFQF